MPNRVIKDSIFTSPSLASLTEYYQDQWPRWLLLADDWGCFNADPDVIKGIAYPKRKETTKQIIKIRNAFNQAGMLFVWIDENLRTWGYFVNWPKHEYIGGTEYNGEGERIRHRRRTPEPPQDLLDKYILEHLGTFGSGLEQTASNPNPIPIPNPITLPSKKRSSAGKVVRDKTPTTQMFAIFSNHWNKHKAEEYSFVSGKDGKIAKNLYLQCCKVCPDAPLKLYEERVVALFEKRDIYSYGALQHFWNSLTPSKKFEGWGKK